MRAGISFFTFRWEWLEDGKMHEMIKKANRVDKVDMMEMDDENDNVASLF